MGKNDYLAALKRAMAGLPAEPVARTLAYYEQVFIDGLAAGRTEEEISQDLDDPKQIAMTLRANVHLDTLNAPARRGGVFRTLFTAMGLAVFNLFMIIPAAVFASLLTAAFACSLAFYVGGIAVTASGLAGANEIVLNGPLHTIHLSDNGEEKGQTRISIGPDGVQVSRDPAQPDTAAAPVIERAEAVADRGVQIYTDLDPQSRTTQTLFGLTMVVGSIIAFLLALVVTRFGFVGLKRYVQMNISLLRG